MLVILVMEKEKDYPIVDNENYLIENFKSVVRKNLKLRNFDQIEVIIKNKL